MAKRFSPKAANSPAQNSVEVHMHLAGILACAKWLNFFPNTNCLSQADAVELERLYDRIEKIQDRIQNSPTPLWVK